MTSRPITCTINNNSINVGYVDFLCVHKKHRKKGIAQKIIYTHAVQASQNMENPIFLFKREGKLNFIVPLLPIIHMHSLKIINSLIFKINLFPLSLMVQILDYFSIILKKKNKLVLFCLF